MTTLTLAEESVLVFAARYAHSRNTGAAQHVCSAIRKHWSSLSIDTQQQIIRESTKAECNFEDWAALRELAQEQGVA